MTDDYKKKLHLCQELIALAPQKEQALLQKLYAFIEEDRLENTTLTPAQHIAPLQAEQKKIFVLGVGAQKCGTSWVFNYIKSSPFSHMGFVKEYHVWDTLYLEDLQKSRLARYLEGLQKSRLTLESAQEKIAENAKICKVWKFMFQNFDGVYEKYFASHMQNDIFITGDISPTYSGLKAEHLAMLRQRLESVGFQVKVVFLMRDPFERFCSSLKHQQKIIKAKVKKPLSTKELHEYFYTTLKKEITSIRARYDLTIQNVEQVFTSEDIFYGIYEEFFTEDNILKLSQFLNIEYKPEEKSVRVNASPSKVTFTYDHMLDCRKHFAQVYEFCYEKFPQTKTLWNEEASLARLGLTPTLQPKKSFIAQALSKLFPQR